MNMLKNKKIVITGIANKFSIAHGIAHSMIKNGAELAFLYQNERLLKKIRPLADKLGVEVPSGVYYYSADVVYDVLNPEEADQIIKGWVQLLR